MTLGNIKESERTSLEKFRSSINLKGLLIPVARQYRRNEISASYPSDTSPLNDRHKKGPRPLLWVWIPEVRSPLKPIRRLTSQLMLATTVIAPFKSKLISEENFRKQSPKSFYGFTQPRSKISRTHSRSVFVACAKNH